MTKYKNRHTDAIVDVIQLTNSNQKDVIQFLSDTGKKFTVDQGSRVAAYNGDYYMDVCTGEFIINEDKFLAVMDARSFSGYYIFHQETPDKMDSWVGKTVIVRDASWGGTICRDGMVNRRRGGTGCYKVVADNVKNLVPPKSPSSLAHPDMIIVSASDSSVMFVCKRLCSLV